MDWEGPHRAAAHNDLAAIHEYRGDLSAAAKHYGMAVEMEPEVAWFHYCVGMALRRAGNLERAAEELRIAAELAPRWPHARWALGNVCVYRHRFAEAVEQARRMREIQGWEAWGDCIEGYALSVQERFDEAVVVLHRGTERDAFCWEALRLLGNAYLSMGELEAARGELAGALVLRPSDPRIHNTLGLVECHSGNHRRARELLRAAIRIEPTCAAWYRNLGLAYYKDGDLEHARQANERAVSLLPEAAYGHRGLGAVYAAMGKWALAAEAYALELRHDPGNQRAFQDAIAMLAKEWAPDAAKALQEEAFAQELSDPEGWRQLADLFEEHGDRRLADECRQEAHVG